MPLPTCSPVTNQSNKAVNEDSVAIIDSESALKEVKDILMQYVDNGELGSKTNDVRKRIGVMEDMWLNGKLNNSIQIKMKELADGKYRCQILYIIF